MAYAGSFSRRPPCGTRRAPPEAAAFPVFSSSPTSVRIPRTSFNSLNITAESHSNKKLRIDECKERLRKQRNRRRPDGEAGDINMSKAVYKHKNV
jgi:hypothetical protein